MFSANITGIVDVVKNIEHQTGEKRKAIKKQVFKSGEKIVLDAKSTCAKGVSSNLRNSIRPEYVNDGLTVIVKAGGNYGGEIDVKYARYVEFGRGPGKRPPAGYYPAGKESSLMQWVRLKLRPGGKRTSSSNAYETAKSISFLIARKIGRVGTKKQPFLYPAWRTEKIKFEQAIREIISGR